MLDTPNAYAFHFFTSEVQETPEGLRVGERLIGPGTVRHATYAQCALCLLVDLPGFGRINEAAPTSAAPTDGPLHRRFGTVVVSSKYAADLETARTPPARAGRWARANLGPGGSFQEITIDELNARGGFFLPYGGTPDYLFDRAKGEG